jgi:hypothetical protein
MTEDRDSDLRTRFSRQRHCDHGAAPAWRPEVLERPVQNRTAPLRWSLFAGMAAACVTAAALVFSDSPPPAPRLGDLPPLLDFSPGELFADLGPSFIEFAAPSDFLLTEPTHPLLP